MTISITVGKDVEAELTAAWGDLPRATIEALAIESYRTRRVSVGFVAKMLGMGVVEAEAWLHERGVGLNYSADDLAEDRRNLERVLGKQS